MSGGLNIYMIYMYVHLPLFDAAGGVFNGCVASAADSGQ